MSGQPNRYATDPANFRAEYMKHLDLRASLDDTNLQANKIYKATGTLPPQSAMTDTRTSAEVLGDVEKLKVSIISAFKPVCDAQMATQVVQRIQSSPYNGDGSLFSFLAQNVDELVMNLKRKYKIGIKGDSNDVEQLVSYIVSAYSFTKDLSTSVKSAFDRPVSSSGGISKDDLDAVKRAYDKIVYSLLIKADAIPTGAKADAAERARIQAVWGSTKAHAERIHKKFEKFDALLNSAAYRHSVDVYTIVKTDPTQAAKLSRDEINALSTSQKQYYDFIEQLPSSVQLNSIMSQLDKAMKSSNTQHVSAILTNLESLLPDSTLIDSISQYMSASLPAIDAILGAPAPPPPPYSPIVRPSGPPPPYSPIVRPSGPPPPYSPIVRPSGPPPATRDPLDQMVLSILIHEIYVSVVAAVDDDLRTGYVRTRSNITREIKDGIIAPYIAREPQAWKDASGVSTYDEQLKLNFKITKEAYLLYNALKDGQTETEDQFVNSTLASLNQSGILGNGLKKRRGRPKGSGIAFKDKIDTTAGVPQNKRFVPFGRYLINNHKLKDDIVAIKSMSGTNVREYPSSRVSAKLGRIIKIIVGGGVPSYNDMSSLSEEERIYLAKVAKKVEIDDKLSIPSPSKDQQEKDIHQFEVMKGEIMSGNDNKDLIKQFKILILKLAHTGALPKRDVAELMTELMQLGY